MFNQNYDLNIYDEYCIFKGFVYNEDGIKYCSINNVEYNFDLNKCIIGHEPQLNDVLEWLKIKGIQIRDTTEPNLLYFGDYKNFNYWNLEYNLLKDQSEELINYLTNLI